MSSQIQLEKLKVTINEKFIPFDFAKLLSNEQIVNVFKEHGIDITEPESMEVHKFLQQWLEVLYLQFKRTNTIKNEPKESYIILPSEFRRAS
jgi:hypothetical protein